MENHDEIRVIVFTAAKILLVSIGVLAFILVLCDILLFSPASAAEDLALEARFYVPEGRDGEATVIVDRETGVCYLWRKDYYAGGFTVLVDAEGDPLLWEDSDD